MNNQLNTLPNIGKALATKLLLAGIDSEEKLKSLGAEDTFIRILTIDPDACINMLYAIEGAIEGIRWHRLTKERKLQLLEFYHMAVQEG